MIKTITMVIFLIAFRIIAVAQVPDVFTPLPENSIHLKGNLEKYIQNAIAHWNKGVVGTGFIYMLDYASVNNWNANIYAHGYQKQIDTLNNLKNNFSF